MTIEDFRLPVGLAVLALCLAVGVWVGHRLARESARMDRLLDEALRRADTDWEDEAPVRPRLDDWDNDYWAWERSCGCGRSSSNGKWSK